MPAGYLERFVETVVSTVDDATAGEGTRATPERLGRQIALLSLQDLDGSQGDPEVLARRITLTCLERQAD